MYRWNGHDTVYVVAKLSLERYFHGLDALRRARLTAVAVSLVGHLLFTLYCQFL